jgi:uncharacterized membrane protein
LPQAAAKPQYQIVAAANLSPRLLPQSTPGPAAPDTISVEVGHLAPELLPMSKRFFLAYGFAAAAFLALDALWLGYIARDFYQSQIGGLLLTQPRMGAAALFYLIYLTGIVVFCVLPGLASGRLAQAAKLGLLFGMIGYATYDLTNLATLTGWNSTVTGIDILWGGFATAVAASVSTWATRAILATPKRR